MSAELIADREEFQRVLAATVDEIDDLAAREPGYSVWQNLHAQLHAMQAWSAAGDPTAEQRARINIGLVAVRELEPPVTPEIAALVDRLHTLSYAWRHWPPTG